MESVISPLFATKSIISQAPRMLSFEKAGSSFLHPTRMNIKRLRPIFMREILLTALIQMNTVFVAKVTELIVSLCPKKRALSGPSFANRDLGKIIL